MMGDPHHTTTNWGTVLVLWAIGLAAAMQFAKFSISLPLLAEHYAVGDSLAAIILSSVGIMGIVFGTTAGALVASIGSRRALIVAMLVGVVASLTQALLPPYEVMLASRLFEGISHLLIVVAAPTAIISHSAERHRSLTMGLWATFFGVAYAIAGLVGPPIQAAYGFSRLFAAHAGLLAVLLFLFLFLDRDAVPAVEARLADKIRKAWTTQLDAYSSMSKSVPALAFFWHTLIFIALLTFLPGLASNDETQRVLGTALPLVTIIGSFVGGAIAQRFARPVGQLKLAFVVFGLLAIVLWMTLGGPAFVPAAGTTMFVSGIIQASAFSAIPQLCHEEAEQAQANGAVTQFGNLGATCGTPLFAMAILQFGNSAVPLMAAAIALLSIIMLSAIQLR